MLQDSRNLRVPIRYVDLDIYSNSGEAIAGRIDWDARLKKARPEIGMQDVERSLAQLNETQFGISIVDFPGMLHDPYQPKRLEAVDQVIILAKTQEDLANWIALCRSAMVGFCYLMTYDTFSDFDADLHNQTKILQGKVMMPIVSDMQRRVVFSPATLTLATSMLEEVARISAAPKLIITLFSIRQNSRSWKNF